MTWGFRAWVLVGNRNAKMKIMMMEKVEINDGLGMINMVLAFKYDLIHKISTIWVTIGSYTSTIYRG